MINDRVITNLRIAHGSYNIFVMILFFYQGFLGLRIRIERKKGTQHFRAIRNHRKSGPVLVGMGITGFFCRTDPGVYRPRQYPEIPVPSYCRLNFNGLNTHPAFYIEKDKSIWHRFKEQTFHGRYYHHMSLSYPGASWSKCP